MVERRVGDPEAARAKHADSLVLVDAVARGQRVHARLGHCSISTQGHVQVACQVSFQQLLQRLLQTRRARDSRKWVRKGGGLFKMEDNAGALSEQSQIRNARRFGIVGTQQELPGVSDPGSQFVRELEWLRSKPQTIVLGFDPIALRSRLSQIFVREHQSPQFIGCVAQFNAHAVLTDRKGEVPLIAHSLSGVGCRR